MAIQIVQSNENLVYEAEGSQIFYRRISTLKRGAIVKKNTNRGKTDWNKTTAEILEYVVIGWEKVQKEGEDIPFASDLVVTLPEDTLTDLLELSGGANPNQEKN